MNKSTDKKGVMKIYIEGNIGSGKTTFINLLRSEQRIGVNFVYEPIKEWLNFKDGDGKNILDHFYKNQKKNGFLFQMNAFITRAQAIKKATSNKYFDKNETTLIIERSVYTDRNCFAKNLYENGKLSELEWKLYCKWFDWLSVDQDIIPNGIIYLRTTPTISYDRIIKRGRAEEQSIELTYLENLHNLHDEWILSEDNEVPVLVLDVSEDFERNYLLFEQYIKKINSFFKVVREVKLSETGDLTDRSYSYI